MKRTKEAIPSEKDKRRYIENTGFNFPCKNLLVECASVKSGNLKIPEKFLEIECTLATHLYKLSFSHPVSHVYNPIKYAYAVHSLYINKFCESKKEIMMLGMNPGPWGMSQTGIPFGEVNIVKEWMEISGEVGQPEKENPARPVLGFACKRSEISGQRFWGLFREMCGEAKIFFQHTLVYNHCPLAFMTKSGKNITPNELKCEERKELMALCDDALSKVISLFQTTIIIAIGRFAEKRAIASLKTTSMDHVKVLFIPHPSPRNFGNAVKWKEIVTEEFEKNALMCYFKKCNDMLGRASEHHSNSACEYKLKQLGDSSVT